VTFDRRTAHQKAARELVLDDQPMPAGGNGEFRSVHVSLASD
jgi:hypothetical protein